MDKESKDANIVTDKNYSELYMFTGNISSREQRINPLIVKIVEELGDDAGSKISYKCVPKLKVVEITDDIEWSIFNKHGSEEIMIIK